MSKKICLFTAHSPLSGGGSVIVRSIIDNIPELDINWYYTAPYPAKGFEEGYCGKNLMGASVVKDVYTTWKLLNLRSEDSLTKLIDCLLEVNCDSYWVISHNEGLRLAWELTKRQITRPVHLTVHDDWAGALCARSIRYRYMSIQAKKLTGLVLNVVTSFDVVSFGMQAYYNEIFHKHGEICHRYLPSRLINASRSVSEPNKSEIKVGHIGSVYGKKQFLKFVLLLKEFAELRGKKATLNMWGCHFKMDDIPPYLRSILRLHENLPEEEVIPKLAQCDFVYSMYPMSSAYKIFSKTSLPTKLTSYLQACRPIFGHGPRDSSLVDFIQTTQTGTFWSSTNRLDGIIAVESILEMNPSIQVWQEARNDYFGEKNLDVMRKVLST